MTALYHFYVRIHRRMWIMCAVCTEERAHEILNELRANNPGKRIEMEVIK